MVHFCDIQKSKGEPAISSFGNNKALSETCFLFITEIDHIWLNVS